jgi:hypothetical protein
VITRILFAVLLTFLVLACSSESSVLTPTFRFFLPFGSEKGAAGTAIVTNDRMPLAGSFIVHEDHLAMFDRDQGRILVYTTDGKLVIDRILEKIETKTTWPSPVISVASSGQAWLAIAEGTDGTRQYRVHAISDDKAAITTAIVFPAGVKSVLGTKDQSIDTLWMERLVSYDNEKLIAIWHGVTRRGNTEVISAMALSIADLKTKKISSHRIDFDEIKKNESGDARFDTVTSVHHFTDAKRFILEAQYRKADIRNPFEKALFLFDSETGITKKIEIPWSNWNAFVGIAREGSLFFIEDVLMHNAATRAIISIYRLDTSKQTRYAIESDPARPSMGNFVFSREGAIYSFEALSSGIRFYSWK